MLKIPKKPIIVHNKDFQTILIRVMFPYNEEEENLTKLTLLPSLLMYMNNKYPTEEEFQKNVKKKFILNCSCSKMVVGTTMCLSFNLVVPDIHTLGSNELDEQFEFFHEMIYNPKIIDGGFDKFELEREKRNLHLAIDNAMKNLKAYHGVRALEAVDDEGILSRSIENHREQIDEVTPENLYELYKDVITKYRPYIFVFGNVDKDEINKLMDKYIYSHKTGYGEFKTNYNHFLKVRDGVQVIEEKKEFKDSAISFLYKVKDMTENDFKYLSLVKSLLSSLSSRMLNKKLRDENDLVYASKASNYLRFGVFEVTAYINKNNKDIVIEKIKEVMEDLKNPDNIFEYLENIKDRRRINLIHTLDDKYALINDVTIEELKVDKNMHDSYEEILHVSADDISNFMDRLVLDTIYYVEEEDHE